MITVNEFAGKFFELGWIQSVELESDLERNSIVGVSIKLPKKIVGSYHLKNNCSAVVTQTDYYDEIKVNIFKGYGSLDEKLTKVLIYIVSCIRRKTEEEIKKEAPLCIDYLASAIKGSIVLTDSNHLKFLRDRYFKIIEFEKKYLADESNEDDLV